jgi:hypothetical protein
MIILHDKRLPEEYRKALADSLQDAVFIPFRGVPGGIYESISSHPDIYFFQLDEKTVIHAPSVPQEVINMLEECGIELIKGEEDPVGRYPGTARYNAARVGGFVFGNFGYTDPAIKKAADGKNLKCVNVKQGYTRCSLLAVNDGAIITADTGIAQAAQNEGLETLLISPGSVSLPGEEYGFIGGAGGRIKNIVILLGSMDTHPDSGKIKDFVTRNSGRVLDVGDGPLYDAGSIMCFAK